MKVVLTRVSSASVMIQKKIVGKINHGLLLLLGIQKNDNEEDIEKLIKKIITLRIFNDKKGMNKSIQDVEGHALVVSQFTLFADTKKGRRPNFSLAENPDKAFLLYNKFCNRISEKIPIQQGVFGKDMQINSTNDGPITIILDTKE